MATPTCTSASLNVACFRGQKITRLQKLALIAYYNSKELAANGGTDYTAAQPTTLLAAARAQFDKWDRDALLSAMVAIAKANATAAGASVSADPNVVLPLATKLFNVNEDDLMKMLTLLQCNLGAHAAPPT